MDNLSRTAGRCVWVAYSSRPPYLPVAVADTSKALAAQLGVTESTVRRSWSRYCHGSRCRTRHHKVAILSEEVC